MRSFQLGFMTLVTLMTSLSSCSSKSSSDDQGAGPSGGSGGQSAGSTAGASGTPGSAGGGGAPTPPPVTCGSETCTAITLPGGAVPPCCFDEAQSICGADVSAVMPMMGCQRLTQAGDLDETCPDYEGGMLNGFPVPAFPGCCRPDVGQCGVKVDNLGGVLPFMPGCIDSAPFFNGAAAPACGSGSNGGTGSGGTSATGGSPATGGTSGSSGSGAGGDPDSGGANSGP